MSEPGTKVIVTCRTPPTAEMLVGAAGAVNVNVKVVFEVLLGTKVLSPALVATTKQVPAAVAVRDVPLIEQPVAVPPVATEKLNAPVPLPPVALRVIAVFRGAFDPTKLIPA